MSMKKKRMDQILLPGSIVNMAGYATNASSIPLMSISVISISNLSEIWPRNEKSTQAASILVALLIIGSQKLDFLTFSSLYRQLP